MTVLRAYLMVCDCGFVTKDSKLMDNHNCETQLNGGSCEDFPCCGHEAGDCNGQLYGSDEAIKERVYADMANEHDYDYDFDEPDRRY